jgi:selenium metabolism protein YedF
MSAPIILDCTGLVCPRPVIQTKEALEQNNAQVKLQVIVDNEAACDNVRRFAESQGGSVQVVRQDGTWELLIQDVPESVSQTAIVCDENQGAKKIAVHISSEFMGQGDDDLGRRLMAAYFDTLAQFAENITDVTLVNSGVKLICEDSPVLQEAEELARLGVRFTACGVCLNHYGLMEKVKVGTVSNMFSILAVQKDAGLVLSP